MYVNFGELVIIGAMVVFALWGIQSSNNHLKNENENLRRKLGI